MFVNKVENVLTFKTSTGKHEKLERDQDGVFMELML